jgi:hypothetical protein
MWMAVLPKGTHRLLLLCRNITEREAEVALPGTPWPVSGDGSVRFLRADNGTRYLFGARGGQSLGDAQRSAGAGGAAAMPQLC